MTVLSANDLLNSVKTSATDPFHPTSIFTNPAVGGIDQLNGVTGNLSSISSLPGIDSSIRNKVADVNSSMSSYTTLINTNTTNRIKNISSDLPKVMGAMNVQSSLNAADGVVSAPCQLIDDIFGSIKNIGDIIGDTMSQIQGALSSVADLIGEGISWAVGAINAAKDAIIAALGTVIGVISDAVSYLYDMIANELSKLSDLTDDLMGFSFLKNLMNVNVCGHQLLGSIMDSSKIDSDMVKAL